MNEHEARVCRALGFAGPVPDAPVEWEREALLRYEEERGDLPPLDLEGVRRLKGQLEADPEGTLALTCRTVGGDLTLDALAGLLADAEVALAAPQEFLAAHASLAAAATNACAEPPGLFAKYFGSEFTHIPIEPCLRKFETWGDALAWIIIGGAYVIRGRFGRRAPFRWHDAAGVGSAFRYVMKHPDTGAAFVSGQPIRVALFSDCGTGLYYSRYIAQRLAREGADYAIHLGDVYYAGRQSEVAAYLKEPLDPLLATTHLFALNANHEMMSGGIPYFAYLDHKRRPGPARVLQEQEGSYFCLTAPGLQVIGIDTAYYAGGRYRRTGSEEETKLWRWLEARLTEGKNASPPRINVLLTQHAPFRLGRADKNALLEEDLASLVRHVDYWFWGDDHYCARFDPAPAAGVPFLGSCIGHAGYPVDRFQVRRWKALDDAGTRVAPARWVETGRRFPREFGDLRPGMGNPGYCMLDFDGHADVRLTFVDWLGRWRHSL